MSVNASVCTKVCWVQFTNLILSSYIVSHCAKIIQTEYPMVIWGKERAWISKQHKAMRSFKGDGTITANKILEANECVCLCLWQWLRGVNRGISSHLQSLNTSHSHNWIKSVRLLLNCRCDEEHKMHLAPKITSINAPNFSFHQILEINGNCLKNGLKWHRCLAASVRC